MRVYPEIESWNEFYPSEIFIIMADNDTDEDTLAVLKIANIGTTIYIATSLETSIYKKVGDIEAMSDFGSSMLLVGFVMPANGG